ncbi:Arrestin domain-containing protein 2 [Linnemannia gamsii]|uniref:Arrestin domain-containing protein 2 n=1 Tax=Linnemannia gamsii TaxID=64522 RepID=A0ABQ7JLV3_9FUNG|nr:Arrestin domain-containing protein 2 [Linnemannia gamsii]
MNFLFATNSPPPQPSTALACNTALSHNHNSATAGSSPSAVSPTTLAPALQDIELLIDIDASFHGVLLGLPEESAGAVLNATAILHVRKKPIRASKLTATFDGRIKVQCSDGATFGPEQYRERVLAHKDWVLWEAGSSAAAGSGSKNHIPVGTHYYPLSIQLDGALPPTFSGKHGSIRYILSSTLLRPLFYSDISTIQDIEIKRCLVSEAAHTNSVSTHYQDQLDLGSLLVNQLSRAGISGALGDQLDDTHAADMPMGPTTITHHNTHKELLRYTATSPPIAHLEGGLIHIDLTLEPLPPGAYIYSIAYGLKEVIHYRSSATGNLADNKAEILYPIGQQTVIIPRDQERERSMSSAGAGASTRQLLELRPCPLLTNVDTITPLIEIHHRITCNVAIVLPDPVRRRNTITGNRSLNGFGGRTDHTNDQHGGAPSGGGILRRLNLTPQPLTPSLNLVDSTGTEVTNNVVLLGEPTHSIIEPAPMPASVELNDAPPPPPASQIESTLLEFPIILTSRYPTMRTHVAQQQTDPLVVDEQVVQDAVHGGESDYAYQALGDSSFSSSQFIAPARSRSMGTGPADHQQQQAPVQQFVHNQVIAPAIIPTTGTTIQPRANGSLAVPSAMSTSPSSSTTSSRSSTDISGTDQRQSSSSSRGSPEVSSQGSSPSSSGCMSSLSPDGSPMNVGIGVSAGVMGVPRGSARSGISDGLRAAAAAAASSQVETESVASPFSSLSRPPSYGRPTAAQPTLSTAPPPPQDELPKYEDVMDYGSSNNNISSSGTESGLGITIPRSSPMPMPMRVPCRGSHSTSPQAAFSPQSIGMSHSPLRQQIHRNNSGRILASPPSSSPISPATEGALSIGRDGQRSSPQAIRGHARSGSTTSVLHSTSLARSQQSSSGFLSMTPSTAASTTTQLQYSFPTQSPIQRQASIGQQQCHQRQRSVGAATIMGSLGRNGGYLSHQPAPLTMSSFDCMSAAATAAASSSILVSSAGRATSPPAYVE